MGLLGWFKKAAPAAVAVAASANAGQTVATNSWEFVAPAGWTVDLTTKPVRATGPGGELVQFSSYGIPSEDQGPEAKEIRSKVESNALESFRAVTKEPDVTVESPLASRTLPSGVRIHEIVLKSKDGKLLSAQFALLGPRAAVMITLDAPASTKALPSVREAINKIKWVP